jgi:hypothetical protein
MLEFTGTIPIPSSLQELEEAIRRYIASDLSNPELFEEWQAIRDASLIQEFSEPENDKVSGEDSY